MVAFDRVLKGKRKPRPKYVPKTKPKINLNSEPVKSTPLASDEKLPPNPLKLDPTRLQSVRRTTVQMVQSRYKQISEQIYKKIIDERFLQGVPESPLIADGTVNLDTQPSDENAYNIAKADELELWLSGQVARLLDVEFVTDYVERAYKHGRKRAYTDSHKSKLKPQPNVVITNAADFEEGGKEAFLREGDTSPSSKKTKQSLISQAFSTLKGIAGQMVQSVKQIILVGIRKFWTPKQIAKAVQDEIERYEKRSETSVKDDLVRAHGESQLDAFAELGHNDVTAIIETAGDYKVCAKCRMLEGREIPIEQARGLIPAHPNCYEKNVYVMTNSGWKLFKDVTMEDMFLSENPETREVEFVKPKQLIQYHYDGIIIRFTDYKFSLGVTFDHMMYVENVKGERSFVKAHELLKNNSYYIPITFNPPFSEKTSRYYQSVLNLTKQIISYNDMVYCVELEKWHTLYVMKNGKATWCGNCRCAWKPIPPQLAISPKEKAKRLKETAKDTILRLQSELEKYQKEEDKAIKKASTKPHDFELQEAAGAAVLNRLKMEVQVLERCAAQMRHDILHVRTIAGGFIQEQKELQKELQSKRVDNDGYSDTTFAKYVIERERLVELARDVLSDLPDVDKFLKEANEAYNKEKNRVKKQDENIQILTEIRALQTYFDKLSVFAQNSELTLLARKAIIWIPQIIAEAKQLEYLADNPTPPDIHVEQSHRSLNDNISKPYWKTATEFSKESIRHYSNIEIYGGINGAGRTYSNKALQKLHNAIKSGTLTEEQKKELSQFSRTVNGKTTSGEKMI
ncbi:MAG: hypothetical protein LBF88_13610, partial [Planctomycetaceae bacterium]|nr:hypothetical protein [Planctomycetaceae bacterium]